MSIWGATAVTAQQGRDDESAQIELLEHHGMPSIQHIFGLSATPTPDCLSQNSLFGSSSDEMHISCLGDA